MQDQAAPSLPSKTRILFLKNFIIKRMEQHSCFKMSCMNYGNVALKKLWILYVHNYKHAHRINAVT